MMWFTAQVRILCISHAIDKFSDILGKWQIQVLVIGATMNSILYCRRPKCQSLGKFDGEDYQDQRVS